MHIIDSELRDLPHEVNRLKYLQELILSGNLLGNLPESMSTLLNLKSIDLAQNKFVEIPQVIFKLVNLQRINLQGNQLNSIPLNLVECLPNLEYFNVGCNNLPENQKLNLKNHFTPVNPKCKVTEINMVDLSNLGSSLNYLNLSHNIDLSELKLPLAKIGIDHLNIDQTNLI